MILKKENKEMKKIKKKNKIKKSLSEKLNLKDESIHFSIAILLIFLAIFLTAAAFETSGIIGKVIYETAFKFFGVGYYLFPIICLIIAIVFFKNIHRKFTKIKFFGLFLFIFSGLGFIDLIFANGGYIGSIISEVKDYLGNLMAVILSLILIIISQVIIFDGIPKFSKKNKKEFFENSDGKLSEAEEEKIEKTSFSSNKNMKSFFYFGSNSKKKDLKNKDKDKEKGQDQPENKEEKKIFKISKFEKVKNEYEEKLMTQKIKNNKDMSGHINIILPPLKLLSQDKGNPDAGDIQENANLIKKTLHSFGISVEIEGVSVGPTVTRYTLKPAVGVRVSKIAALNDDLALALAAKSIIIQTPIPGHSLVGIEIPNKNKITVGAGSLIGSKEFKNSEFILPLAIGRDISGEVSIIGLETTPHMLIAGATGSGKSVTIHAIINSLLYKHGPDFLKFILIDPKRVEMTLYNGIPHLLTPVIVDAKKAILSLRWAATEMERRYEILENYKLRDVASYHKNILMEELRDKEPEKMPYIVIVIDELADIMQQYPKELEFSIVTIAQKARAVGIHLILSTQRPSVNVVTGLIKANIPTRIALQVSSAIDSKTILDQGGAEKLLGRGDMLYVTGSMSKPVRVQSSFISEDEVKSVVKFIKKTYKNILNEEISLGNQEKDRVEVTNINFDDNQDFDADPLLKDAINEVIASRKASTSYLQRKLGIGYARAARLIDILEEKGIVGPINGSKPREVLVQQEDK